MEIAEAHAIPKWGECGEQTLAALRSSHRLNSLREECPGETECGSKSRRCASAMPVKAPSAVEPDCLCTALFPRLFSERNFYSGVVDVVVVRFSVVTSLSRAEQQQRRQNEEALNRIQRPPSLWPANNYTKNID